MLHDLDLLWLRIQHLEKETSWKQLLMEFGFPPHETMLFPYENNETKQRDQEVLLFLVLPMDIKHIVLMYFHEMYAISNEHLESLIQHVDAFDESLLRARCLKLERHDVVSFVDSAILQKSGYFLSVFVKKDGINGLIFILHRLQLLDVPFDVIGKSTLLTLLCQLNLSSHTIMECCCEIHNQVYEIWEKRKKVTCGDKMSLLNQNQ